MAPSIYQLQLNCEVAVALSALMDLYVDEMISRPRKLDDFNADGEISNYYPDFFVKMTDGRHYIIETKGPEDLDVPHKLHRLKQWCIDVNQAQSDQVWDFVYVDHEGFQEYRPDNFGELAEGFREYK